MNGSNESRQRQIDLILMTTARYYGIDLAEDTLELYHSSLAEYLPEAIRYAFTLHIKTSKWFPKVCELIAILKPHVPGVESIAEKQAAYVLEMIRSYGYLREPVWADPITRFLFESRRFNWKSLCNTLTENENKWFVKEFKEAYLAASDMCGGDPTLLETPGPIKGLLDGILKPLPAPEYAEGV